MEKLIYELLATEEGKLEINKMLYLWRWHANDEDYLSLCSVIDENAVRIESRDVLGILSEVEQAINLIMESIAAEMTEAWNAGDFTSNIVIQCGKKPAAINYDEMPKNFAELVRATGRKMTWLSEYLGVPYRTIQDWKSGARNCPAYAFKLMIRTMREDGII